MPLRKHKKSRKKYLKKICVPTLTKIKRLKTYFQWYFLLSQFQYHFTQTLLARLFHPSWATILFHVQTVVTFSTVWLPTVFTIVATSLTLFPCHIFIIRRLSGSKYKKGIVFWENSHSLTHYFTVTLTVNLFLHMGESQKFPKSWTLEIQIFWGELIDKYKDINANSKTVFTDYAMLKLVHIVPIYF